MSDSTWLDSPILPAPEPEARKSVTLRTFPFHLSLPPVTKPHIQCQIRGCRDSEPRVKILDPWLCLETNVLCDFGLVPVVAKTQYLCLHVWEPNYVFEFGSPLGHDLPKSLAFHAPVY